MSDDWCARSRQRYPELIRRMAPVEMSNDHKQLCDLLGQLVPGILPRDVFEAIARLVVLPTFVVVPLQRQGPHIRVLLKERDPDDLHYAGMLHPAGTVIRPTDEGLVAVYRRLMASELADVGVRRGPVFVNTACDVIARGREISLVHWIEIEEGVSDRHLFDVDTLPGTIVPSDYPRIIDAVDHFRTHSGVMACAERPRAPSPPA